MDWHGFSSARSPLIRRDNRFSLSHTDIQPPVYAHLPSWTSTQTAFQYLTQKHPRAHTQLFEISWLYKHCSTVYLKRHRYLLLLAKVFSKNAKAAVRWGSLQHLKIRKENIDYTEIYTFLSTCFQVFGTAVCHLEICCCTYSIVLQ